MSFRLLVANLGRLCVSRFFLFLEFVDFFLKMQPFSHQPGPAWRMSPNSVPTGLSGNSFWGEYVSACAPRCLVILIEEHPSTQKTCKNMLISLKFSSCKFCRLCKKNAKCQDFGSHKNLYVMTLARSHPRVPQPRLFEDRHVTHWLVGGVDPMKCRRWSPLPHPAPHGHPLHGGRRHSAVPRLHGPGGHPLGGPAGEPGRHGPLGADAAGASPWAWFINPCHRRNQCRFAFFFRQNDGHVEQTRLSRQPDLLMIYYVLSPTEVWLHFCLLFLIFLILLYVRFDA